jgi:hypothetical protein
MATETSLNTIFSYLVNHDLDEAKDFFDPGWKEAKGLTSHPVHTVKDIDGTITLNTPDGPLTIVFESSFYEANTL